MKIPFVDLKGQYLSIQNEIDQAIKNILEEANFIGGTPVKNFEREFSSLLGVRNCVGVANGTDALYITLKMLGVKEGDEVITVCNSWISTSETITQAGAKPVFVDICPDYFTIDPEGIEEKITSKTKAIIPVHLYGQAAHIKFINDLARKHGLSVIEDCAQSHLSQEDGQNVGTFGIAGTFSFYPGKNLGAYGDAGAVITNDDSLAQKIRMYANHGALKKHEHEIEGINSRLDSLQAAILSAKLKHLTSWTTKRIENAATYTKKLEDIDEIETPIIRSNTRHTFHLYVIRTQRRDELKQYLESKGVQTAIHYPRLLPNLPAYKYLGHTKEDFPVANKYEKQILSLPMFPEMTETQIEYVAENVRTFFRR